MIRVRKRKILLLPGDGIGPEVIAEVKKIIEWFNKKKSLDFETEEGFGSVRRHLGDSEYGNLLEYYSDRNNQRKNQEETGGTSRYADRETRKAFVNALEYFNR